MRRKSSGINGKFISVGLAHALEKAARSMIILPNPFDFVITPRRPHAYCARRALCRRPHPPSSRGPTCFAMPRHLKDVVIFDVPCGCTFCMNVSFLVRIPHAHSNHGSFPVILPRMSTLAMSMVPKKERGSILMSVSVLCGGFFGPILYGTQTSGRVIREIIPALL